MAAIAETAGEHLPYNVVTAESAGEVLSKKSTTKEEKKGGQKNES